MKRSYRYLFIVMILIVTTLISSGCSLFGRLAPTVTPVATATILPSATPAPTSTPIPTDTPDPSPTGTDTSEPSLAPTSEVFQQIQSDGSILVQDRKNGYQISVPPSWTILDLTSGDLDQVLSASTGVSPEISQMINNYKTLLTQGAGIMAIDTDVSHSKNMIYPILLSIGLMDNLSAALPLNFIIEANVQSMKQMAPDAQILSSDVSKNKNDLEIGLIEVSLPTKTTYGNANAYERLVIFKVKGGLTLMVMVTDQSMVDTMDPILQDMIDSIDTLE